MLPAKPLSSVWHPTQAPATIGVGVGVPHKVCAAMRALYPLAGELIAALKSGDRERYPLAAVAGKAEIHSSSTPFAPLRCLCANLPGDGVRLPLRHVARRFRVSDGYLIRAINSLPKRLGKCLSLTWLDSV